MALTAKKSILLGIVIVAVATGICVGPLMIATARERFYLGCLDSDNDDVRKAAAYKLAEMKSRKAIPRLAALFKRDGERRPATCHAFFIPYRLKHHYSGRALIAIGAPSVPYLLDMLGHDFLGERDAFPSERDALVFSAIVQIGPPGIPALLEALQDKEFPHRDWILLALGRMGPTAADALPVVTKLLQDRRLSQSARYALHQIKYPPKESRRSSSPKGPEPVVTPCEGPSHWSTL